MVNVGTEERSIRPIIGDDDIIEAFSGIRLQFDTRFQTNTEESIGHQETKRLSETDFLQAHIGVSFAENQQGFKDFYKSCKKSIKNWEIELTDVSIAIFVLNPLLRRADQVLLKSMEEFENSDFLVPIIEGSSRPDSAWSLHSETRVEVVAFLNAEQDFKLLKPFRAGTWLAKAHFSIRTQLETASFTVEPLDGAERERLGEAAFGEALPTGTVTYLELPPNFNPVDPNSDIQELRMFLNETVWNLRESDPDSTFTNVLNRFLAVEVFTEVFDVAQHFLTNDDDWDSLESTAGSILHNAITSMSKDPEDQENYFQLAKRDPRSLRAIWEDLHIEGQGIADLQNIYTQLGEK